MRVTSVAPDLSSASARVSETVSTAILSGTTGFVSSMPAMGLSAASMRVTSVAPDLSSASARVSETVSTAILSGTNGFVSSMPAMGLSAELQLGGRKGVAAVDRALLEAGVEPAHALVGRAVGEAVRDHGAARLTLQPVVADRRGGFQRGLDVARIEE